MANYTASYAGLDQRASPRTDVYARLPVILPDGRATMVTLVNISADGLLMRHEHRVDDGGVMTISLPILGKVKGIAIWSVGGRSGVNFIETIRLDDYQHVLRGLGVRSAS